MSGLETLPPDQRAVLQLILKQGRGYADLAGLLKIDPDAVRARAHAGLDALVPADTGRGLPPERRGQVADYVLGQLDGEDAASTRRHLADSAAAHLMKSGAVQWVIVGADRIAANGDTANKIGTYQLAIVAKYHGVKFMVVAPSSTVDMATGSGEEIEIELRDPAELLSAGGKRCVIEGAQAWNPVFDVAPAELIDAIVTDPPYGLE